MCFKSRSVQVALPTNQGQQQRQSSTKAVPGKALATTQSMESTTGASGIRTIRSQTSTYPTLMAPRSRTIGRTKTTQASTATHTPIGAITTCRTPRTFQLRVTNQTSTALIRMHEFLAIFLSRRARRSMSIRKKL